MGCQCFRNIFKSSDIDYTSFDKEQNNSFDINKAKNIVAQCLSNDCFYYSNFLNVILEFDDEDFQKLFEGTIDEKKDDLCERYEISKKDEFFKLIYKFENFQTILTQMYKNKKYYPYLISLWKEFPNMNVLKTIYDDEEKLEYELRGINYSDWDYEVKEELKKAIRGSPEVQSMNIKNYISKYPEIESLLKCSINYKKTLNNYYEQGMEDMKTNLKNFVKNLIEEFTKDFNGNNENLLSGKKQEIKGSSELRNSIKGKIQKYIYEEFDKEDLYVDSYISFEKLKDILDQIKNGKIFDFIQNGLNNSNLSKLNIFGAVNVGFAVLQFCSSVHELYQCFFEYDELNDKFKEELYEIQKRFEEHRNIGVLPKDYDESLEILYNAIEKIKDDKNDLWVLICKINNAITEKKRIKKTSIFKIIKNVVKVGVCVGGVIATGGLAAVGFGIAGAAHGIRVICHSKRLHNAKKDIKNYLQTMERALEIDEIIVSDLVILVKKYVEIRDQYKPKDLRNEYI